MTIPSLKRVRVSSGRALAAWLAKDSRGEDSVMLVIHNRAGRENGLSREEINDAVGAHGWAGGHRYSLNNALTGHVITRRGPGGAGGGPGMKHNRDSGRTMPKPE